MTQYCCSSAKVVLFYSVTIPEMVIEQSSSIVNLHWDRGGGGMIPTGIIGY